MSLFGAFDSTKHLEELGTPLPTAGGMLTPTQRRALALLNLSGGTMSAAQLAFLAGVTAGTGAASKALVLDSGGNVVMPANGMFEMSNAVVAAIGSDAAGAAVIAAQINVVTGADGAKGVALPAAVDNHMIYILNSDASSNLLVYPLSGGNDNINSLAEDLAYTLGPGRAAWFVATSAVQWYTAAETISETFIIPAAGAAKLGGSGAGWVIDGDNALPLATLPASQTSEVLLMPIHNLKVGDIVTSVGVIGQVESAGGTVTIAMDVRKVTAAAADVTDASIGTDNLGAGVTADTILSQTNLGVTGLTETMAADEMLYVTITATTAGSTDIALMGLNVTVSRRVR